jgi:hypothetical protein
MRQGTPNRQQNHIQVTSTRRTQMRTLVTTFVVGICLVAGPALAQQHPWVPGGMYAGSLPNGDSPARAYGRIRSGDIVDPLGWRTGRPATDDELYDDDACRSSHPVFSCPGTQ